MSDGETRFSAPYEAYALGSPFTRWKRCLACGHQIYANCYPAHCPGCGRRAAYDEGEGEGKSESESEGR